MWTRDYGSERRIAHEETADRAASAEGLRGLLGVPLAVRGRVLGALLAAKRQERRLRRRRGPAAVRPGRPRGRRHRQRPFAPAAGRVGGRAAGHAAPGRRAHRRGARGRRPRLVARAGAGDDADPAGLARPRRRAAAAPRHRPTRWWRPATCWGRWPSTTTDPPADVVLLMERAAPVLALTLAGRLAAERADRLGRDIATVDLLTRAEADPAAERRRFRGAGLDPRREHVVVVADGDPDAARRWAAGLPGGPGAAAALRGQLVLVRPADGTDLDAAWRRPGAPTAGLAGPVPADGLRRAYADAGRTARALTALGRDGALARAGRPRGVRRPAQPHRPPGARRAGAARARPGARRGAGAPGAARRHPAHVPRAGAPAHGHGGRPRRPREHAVPAARRPSTGCSARAGGRGPSTCRCCSSCTARRAVSTADRPLRPDAGPARTGAGSVRSGPVLCPA